MVNPIINPIINLTNRLFSSTPANNTQQTAQPLVQVPQIQTSSSAPLSQQFTKIDIKQEVKQYQKNLKDSIDKQETFVKEEKRRRETILTTVVFNGFLLAAGFLTVIFVPLITSVLLPPVGLILLSTFASFLAGSVAVGFGTSGLLELVHDGHTEEELKQFTNDLEEMQKSQKHFEEDVGFDKFLSRFKGPYRIEDFIKYGQLFRKERKFQENLDRLNFEEDQVVIDSLTDENHVLKAEIETLDYQLRHPIKKKGENKSKKNKIHPNLQEWIGKPLSQTPETHLVDLKNDDSIYMFGNYEQLFGADKTTKRSLSKHGYASKYRFLSNDHVPSAGGIAIDKESFKTVEHYFQAQKAKTIKDDEGFYMIKDAPTAQKARQIANERYGDYRLPNENKMMKKALFAKFVQEDGESPTAEGVELIKTGNRKLIAGHHRGDNYNDKIWGAPFTHDYGLAIGENRLGELLTQLRDMLATNNPEYK